MSRYFPLRVLAAVLAVAVTAPALASDSRTLISGGRERSYLVYRPANLSRAAKVPLVVMLHGGFGTGAQAERSYGWDKMADRAGFVAVFPDGERRAWNAGGECCGLPAREGIDDVAFLDQLIATVVREEGIDPARIYMTGMSNGAAMTYRYACSGRVRLAAIGPVAGSFSAPCGPVRFTPVMAIHGLDDHNVPFAGGHSVGKPASNVDWLGVERSLEPFRRAGHCAAPALASQGVVTTSTAICDAGAEVVLVTVGGAGHQWPGSERPRAAWLLGLDPVSDSLDATAQLWGFFRRHRAGND